MTTKLPEALSFQLMACGSVLYQTDSSVSNKELVDIVTSAKEGEEYVNTEVSSVYTSCYLIKTESGEAYVISHGGNFYETLGEDNKLELISKKILLLDSKKFENSERAIYLNYERDETKDRDLKLIPETSTPKEINFPLKPLALVIHPLAYEKIFSIFMRNVNLKFEMPSFRDSNSLPLKVAKGTTFLISEFVEEKHSSFFLKRIKIGTSDLVFGRMPDIAESVYKICSPYVGFSSELFQNIVQKSTVSKVFSSDSLEYMLVLDSLTMRSQEGGVVLDQTGSLLGFLIPLMRVQSIPANFLSICVSPKPIIECALFKLSQDRPRPKLKDQQTNKKNEVTPPVSSFMNIIPSLSYRSVTWASGILINAAKGLVLTAGHFFDGLGDQSSWSQSDFKLRFPFAPTVFLNFKLLERGQGSYDIALIQITSGRYFDEFLQDNIRFFYDPLDIDQDSEFKLNIGEEVWAVGYGFFSPQIQNMPMMSSGVVGKVIYANNSPFFVVSDCKIFEGYSGGGLFTKKGKLAGLIICNLKEKGGTKVVENLNFSIHRKIIENIKTLNGKLSAASNSELREKIIASKEYRMIWIEKDEELEKLNSMQTRDTVPIFKIKPKM